MRIIGWDIEASNLNADFGIILCVGFKTVDQGRPVVLNILDYTKGSVDLIKAEKRLLKDVSVRLLDCEAWLTHFGTHYDIKFVNSRLLYHSLPILPPNYPHIDTWKVSKYKLRLRNNRLATIQQFLRLPEEKNSIKPEEWLRAMGGHRPSMDYIVEHCRRDVMVLEAAYLKLRPLITDHPHSGLGGAKVGCPVCGEGPLQKRGFHLTRTRRYQRFQCQACGAWSKDPKPVAKAGVATVA